MTDHAIPISTIGVTTADRPELLERCLQSVIRQVAAAGTREIRILVVDASRDAKNEALARQATANVGSANGHRIAFFGRREKLALRRTLRSACDESLLAFAFRPGASGNRNIILLLTRGENVLFVDDDMVCDVWRPPLSRPEIALGGHLEERDIAFYTRRADVCKTLIPAHVDLMGVHQVVLGRTIRSVVSGQRRVEARNACSHIREAARGRRPSLIRMTFTGIAGDAGATYPDRLLFSTGTWKDVLARDATAFKRAFRFREVCKVPTRYIVMHYVSCMAACMGLSNSSVVPPFLPVGRNEDGLFGAMMSAMDRRTASCFLPYAAVHASSREARYATARFPSASETRIADLLISLINFWPPAIRANDPGRRLVRLGEWLRDFGALSRRDFVSAISLATLRTREMELHLIDAALDDDSYPAYWQRDLRAYKKMLLAHIGDPSFVLPLEFRTGGSADTAYDDVRRFVRTAGQLMSAWPSLWRAARTTVSRGER